MQHSLNPDLVTERHEWLLSELFTERKLLTNDVADELGVSVDTVRRDLRTLHDKGLLRRVHGGAVPASLLPDSFTERQANSEEARSRLAATVVSRFRSGQVVGLDAGSTSVEVAALIPHTLEITVVTNNPAVAVRLTGHPSAKAILIGGQVDLRWMACVGSEAVDSWRKYRLDLGVLGVCGLDSESGATTNSQAEVATKLALIESSAEVLLPVQTDKLATVASYVVAPVTDIDTVIVERDHDAGTRRELKRKGVQVLLAD